MLIRNIVKQAAETAYPIMASQYVIVIRLLCIFVEPDLMTIYYQPIVCGREWTKKSGKMAHLSKGKLVAVIGDEDTCTGFLLGGIGEINNKRQPNFMVVEKETSVHEIEECFRAFVARTDIAIILINQNIAEHIRHLLDNHTEPVPAVLEIPSKDSPYDPSKDSILRRAKGMFSVEDFR